jgi:hypothetical protein
MTNWRKMLMVAAGLATTATVIPTAALADGYGRGHRKHHHHHHRYHERVYVEERPVYYRERVYVEERPVYRERYYEPAPRYYREAPRRSYRSSCRSGGTTGLIVGAGAGALLGREIDRTDRC